MNSLARTILLVLIVLILVGAFSTNGFDAGYYGYSGSGLFVMILVLILLEKL